MQTNLITPREVGYLSRDISQHVDEARIETYIRESENIDIKSALGDTLFLDVKANPSKHTLLLDGGTYQANGKKEVFSGLKTALAYYTYARVVKNVDTNVTRFGLVHKDSEYSSEVEFKEKMQSYNDAFSIADSYLKECVRFLSETKYELYDGKGKIISHRTRFRIIGE